MSLTFPPNGTNVPLSAPEIGTVTPNIPKTAQDVDMTIASLCHIQKITPDVKMREYYQGALMALLWVRHNIGITQASEVARELIRGVRNA